MPLILATGLILRLYSIHFGLPALNDPDELTFELGAIKMLGDLTLNPGWFGHPATTTMYVLAITTVAVFGVGHLLGQFGSIDDFANAIYADPSWVMLPGRIAMAVFAVATIYLTYRLALALFGRRVALLAINPVHVTWSQIIRSDMMACFFMLLGMLAALRIAREGHWRDHVLAALWVGAAMATKWPYAITAMAVFGASACRVLSHPDRRIRSLWRLALFAAMALGFLFLISPYLLLDHETALRNMRGEAQTHHLGATGGGFWYNALWYLGGPVRAGLGLAGLALAVPGLAIIARRREAALVILPVTGVFLVVLCTQSLVWTRWVLALMPPLTIAAAVGIDRLVTSAARRQPRSWQGRRNGAAYAAVLAAVLIEPALGAVDDATARLNDTRQLASQWARANVRPGSTVLLEHFAFDLLPQPWHFLFPFGELGCVDVRAYLDRKVQLSSVQKGRGSRTNIDYGTVLPARRETCRSDYAILTQADRYEAERDAFPAQAEAYHRLIAQGTVVATFAPQPGRIGGPTVRIVRFAH